MPRAMRFRRSLTHPVGRAIAALYPSPNRSAHVGNYVASPTQRDRTDHFDVRSDTAFGGAFDLMARYSFADRRLFEPFSGPGFLVAAGLWQRCRAPRTEFRRERDAYPVAEPAERNARRVQPRVGQRVSGRGQHRQSQRRAARAVGATRATRGSASSPFPAIRRSATSTTTRSSGTTNTIHVADTLTWTRGNHLVKAGFDGRLIRQDAFRDVQARGSLTFTGAFTGNPLVDLLVGLPTFTTLARVDNPQRLRTESYAWFVQDSYRVRPNVTLSAGLRYDLTSPPVDVDDRATLYDPQTGALCCRSGPAACRAPATTPIATTGRRASAPRGRSTKRRRPCCAARTASTTTIRRSRPAKGCTSARRISILRRSLRRRAVS